MTATIDNLQCEFSQSLFDRARELTAHAAQFAAMPDAGADGSPQRP